MRGCQPFLGADAWEVAGVPGRGHWAPCQDAPHPVMVGMEAELWHHLAAEQGSGLSPTHLMPG